MWNLSNKVDLTWFELEVAVKVQKKNHLQEKALTSFEDYAVVRYFVPGLQAGAVPAVSSELVLALVDSNLDSLDCGGCNVWITHTHLQLASCQSRQRQTHCVGIQDGLNIGKLQAQDFIGVYPACSTHGRLLTRNTVINLLLLFTQVL